MYKHKLCWRYPIWSLYLLSGDAHVICHIWENGGLNEEAFHTQSFAATLQLGAFTDAALDKLQHAILLLTTDLHSQKTDRMWKQGTKMLNRLMFNEFCFYVDLWTLFNSWI